MIVSCRPSSRMRCATKYAVDEQSRNTLWRGASVRDRGPRQRPLGIRRGLDPGHEGVLVGRDGGEHRAAVRAAGQALALEVGEVAPRGHRRDAEALLELAHGDRARAAQQVRDRSTTGLRQHRALRCSFVFDLTVSSAVPNRNDQIRTSPRVSSGALDKYRVSTRFSAGRLRGGTMVRLRSCAALVLVISACVAGAAPAAADQPWRDASQPPGQRAAELLAAMTPDQKVAMALGDYASLASLGVPTLPSDDGPSGIRAAARRRCRRRRRSRRRSTAAWPAPTARRSAPRRAGRASTGGWGRRWTSRARRWRAASPRTSARTRSWPARRSPRRSPAPRAAT